MFDGEGQHMLYVYCMCVSYIRVSSMLQFLLGGKLLELLRNNSGRETESGEKGV